MIRKRPAKKAKNGYTYQVYFYYRDIFDKRKYYSKSGFLTKKEAQIHEAQMKAELKENGSINTNRNLTFTDVYNEFLEAEEQLYSPNTISCYKMKYRKYLKNDIGNMKIMHICDYEFLQSYLNSYSHLSQSNLKSLKATIFNVLRFAIKKRYTYPIDLSLIKANGVRSKTKERVIISYELFLKVYNELKPFQAILIAIGYYTGMRIAEITALTWNDIDFENNLIDINKQLTYLSRTVKNYEVREILKTSKSRSTIPLAEPLKILLLNYKEKYPYNPICSNKGKYFDILNFDRRLKRKYGFTYHDLRHTFTTNVISKGTDIKIAQELLRHENYNITLSLYTHIDDSSKLGAVNDVFNIKNVKNMPKMKNLN